MHLGNLCNIVQCKIICSDDLIWKVGRTFGYVVNKYLSMVNETTFGSDMFRVFLLIKHSYKKKKSFGFTSL